MMYDYVIYKPPLEVVLEHSGIKGMEWKKHKYLKKEDGTYIYPAGMYGNTGESALDILNRQKTKTLMKLTSGGGSSSSESSSGSSKGEKEDDEEKSTKSSSEKTSKKNKKDEDLGEEETDEKEEDLGPDAPDNTEHVDFTEENKVNDEFYLDKMKDGRIAVASTDYDEWVMPKGVELTDDMESEIISIIKSAGKNGGWRKKLNEFIKGHMKKGKKEIESNMKKGKKEIGLNMNDDLKKKVKKLIEKR